MFFRLGLFQREPGLAATLHERFERQATLRSRSVALECDGVQLTYGELNQDANRMARRLVKAGVQADTVVVLAMERSYELMVAMLAVLKAGGAFVVLDGSLVSRQREAFLRASGAGVIVTDTARPFTGRTVVRYFAASGDHRNLERRTQTDRWACVMGGKVRSHEAVLKTLDAARHENEFRAGDGLFSAADLSGNAVLDLFLPLIAGGRLVLASKEELREAERLAERAKCAGCRLVRLPNQSPLAADEPLTRAASAGQSGGGTGSGG